MPLPIREQEVLSWNWGSEYGKQLLRRQ